MTDRPDDLADAMAGSALAGLWTRPDIPPAPVARAGAHLWRWDTVLPLAQRAATAVRIDGFGDARRALQFCNPGLPMGTTESLFGAYQYLAPGETAPAHRHSAAAIRFVVQGNDVFTTVDGDACDMTPGDLILTPNGAWHDHTHHGTEPIVWFDAIDVPLVMSLEAMFFEHHPGGMQDVIGHNSPVLRYPYGEVSGRLDAAHDAEGGPSATITYENPVTGGPVMATISCQMTRVYPGARTPPHRQTGGQIHVVFRGRGRSVIAGTEFAWSAGDVFVVPSWAPVEHEADDVSDVFVVSNRAVLEALHLYREEVLDNPQQVAVMFENCTLLT
ncbi:MAG: cupin domain-containing protein [Actinomycetota bacterium]|nr:cupin domain-containing protein [Actinomycetota bacterium]